MNGFLTFLSNNYLYFLIAAGVLFFALIGFLVDLKRKKDDSNSSGIVDETPIPDVVSIDENQSLPEVNEEGLNANEFDIGNDLETPVNPAPPMPSEPTDMTYAEQVSMNGINNESPSNFAEGLNAQEPTVNPIPETIESAQVGNQEQNLEEFK